MKRPLFAVTLGYIIGIIVGLYGKHIALLLFLFLGVTLLFLFALPFLFKDFSFSNIKLFQVNLKTHNFKILVLILTLAIVISYLQTRGLTIKYETIYQEKEEEAELIGTIISDKIEKEYQDTYLIKVEKMGKERKVKNTKLYLNIKKNKQKQVNLEYGDKIKVKAIYQKPEKQRNYKGFDDTKYLRSIGVYGRVKVQGEVKVLKKQQIRGILFLSHKVQEKIKEVIAIFPENTGKLLLGILLGQTQELEQTMKEDFKDSNLSHMLAVSGAHVGYIVLGITILLRNLKLSKNLVKGLTILGLFFFVFLANFTPSVVRACMMGNLLMFAEIIHRKSDTINNLCFALLFTLVLNPYSIFSFSVLFSYGGTIGIIAFFKKLVNKFKKGNRTFVKLKEMLAVTLSAQLIIFPVMWVQFGNISLSFFLSNLLAGPILGIIILSGFSTILIGVFSISLAKIISIIPNFFLNLLLQIAGISAKLPFSKIYLPIPSIILVILYYCFLFSFFFFKPNQKEKITKWVKQTKKYLILVTIFLACIFLFYQNIPKELKIHFIDVRQR